MTPEEEFIREALIDYVEVSCYRTWCSLDDLYRVYKGVWLSRGKPYPGDPDPVLLNRQQFGGAVAAIFPNSIPVTRRANGKRHRGRSGIDGPVARTMKGAGRPQGDRR